MTGTAREAAASTPDAITLSMVRERIFDPPAELEKLLRSGETLHRLRFKGGEVGWLVTGYDAARSVLNDPRFSLREIPPLHTVEPAKHDAIIAMMREEGLLRGDMLTMDPPEHARFRQAITPRFALRSVERFEAEVEEIVARCLDDLAASAQPADLVRTFAAPISFRSQCALLGVPEQDIPMLELIGETNRNPALTADEVIAATREFRAYLDEVVARKRREPGDDLISDIVEGGVLDDEEIVGLLVLLFVAGVETTESMLATGVFALLTHEDQLDLLRGDLTLMKPAVEELMRYLTVFNVGTLTRTATDDVELDGVVIEQGAWVSVSLLGANRDGRRFRHPDLLDIERGGKGQVGFGHGVHVCSGQHLARLELRVGIARLLERFPRLAIARDEDVVLSGDDEVTFGVKRLPVTW
ncbi:putative cytochrome P450 hydroxylase [Patulibacter medicamentivorans]|jgi:cytochrome P450|uniref:Putative cytochrome P450 hydroxylase n=1 Tax=Patulibacter medicamentivorans TaxID=1097667 RepID=H0E0K5_9ACTN|nr:cytochrome P450 [Patulibacter medicamentivorans]EHN12739.1 putative cytochrome P450 hydroxylase [Patulibacter medicamentivorans]